jgi:hypothetical protein
MCSCGTAWPGRRPTCQRPSWATSCVQHLLPPAPFPLRHHRPWRLQIGRQAGDTVAAAATGVAHLRAGDISVAQKAFRDWLDCRDQWSAVLTPLPSFSDMSVSIQRTPHPPFVQVRGPRRAAGSSHGRRHCSGAGCAGRRCCTRPATHGSRSGFTRCAGCTLVYMIHASAKSDHCRMQLPECNCGAVAYMHALWPDS